MAAEDPTAEGTWLDQLGAGGEEEDGEGVEGSGVDPSGQQPYDDADEGEADGPTVQRPSDPQYDPAEVEAEAPPAEARCPRNDADFVADLTPPPAATPAAPAARPLPNLGGLAPPPQRPLPNLGGLAPPPPPPPLPPPSAPAPAPPPPPPPAPPPAPPPPPPPPAVAPPTVAASSPSSLELVSLVERDRIAAVRACMHFYTPCMRHARTLHMCTNCMGRGGAATSQLLQK